MEEIVHDTTFKMTQSKIKVTTTSKDDVEEYFNVKIKRETFMHNFLLQMYHSFLEIWKGCLMRLNIKTI